MSDDAIRWAQWKTITEVLEWVRQHLSTPTLMVPLDHAISSVYEDFGEVNVGITTYSTGDNDNDGWFQLIKFDWVTQDASQLPLRTFGFMMSMNSPNLEGLIVATQILSEDELNKLQMS